MVVVRIYFVNALCDFYYPSQRTDMNLVRLKNSSRHSQLNCVVSYFFQLHLMLHAYVRKFDMTGTVEKILVTK